MRFRVFATIIGVALGTASLTASFNFSETAHRELMKEIRAFKTDLITWRNISYQQNIDNNHNLFTSSDADKMESQLSEFISCTPIHQSGFLNESNKNKRYLPLYGVSSDFSTALHLNLKTGRDISPLEVLWAKPVCVIGSKTADLLFKKNGRAVGQTLKIFNRNYLVIGIINNDQSSNLIDVSSGVFVPHTSFRDLTSFKDTPNIIICRLKNQKNAESALKKGNNFLKKFYKANNFSGFVQKEVIEKQKKMVNTINWLIKTVSLMTLIVACIGCSNIMIVSVNERVREIGLRMALGASKIRILNMFMGEGIVLILFGGIIGIIGGYMLTLKLLEPLPGLISGYSGWEFKFYGDSVVKSLITLFVTAIFSSLLPAWKAASKEPSQALRDN